MKQFSKREITGWIFYDWANSVYSLMISTVIFPIILCFYNIALEPN